LSQRNGQVESHRVRQWDGLEEGRERPLRKGAGIGMERDGEGTREW